MKYINSTHKKAEDCIFCAILEDGFDHDRENYVIYRGQALFALMNIYPYNTGHLMILPYAHMATLSEMAHETQCEMMRLAAYFTDLLTHLLRPDGFNVGLNLGRASGAGVDSHLHLHVVPRWEGDSNFMTVIGQTRVLPEELGATCDKIVAAVKNNPPRLV
jgi:ATP adenylyltransferase